MFSIGRPKHLHGRILAIDLEGKHAHDRHHIDGKRLLVDVLVDIAVALPFLVEVAVLDAGIRIEIDDRAKSQAEVLVELMAPEQRHVQTKHLYSRETRTVAVRIVFFGQRAIRLLQEIVPPIHAVVAPVDSKAHRVPVSI